MQRALGGEATPPTTFNGACLEQPVSKEVCVKGVSYAVRTDVKKNDQRFCSSQVSASFSRSQISPIGDCYHETKVLAGVSVDSEDVD